MLPDSQLMRSTTATQLRLLQAQVPAWMTGPTVVSSRQAATLQAAWFKKHILRC